MARHFFAGGMMPSPTLPLRFARGLAIERSWSVDGRQYRDTLEAWLARMDARKREIMPLFERTYGPRARAFWHYWRTFFLVCAEVFGYDHGRRWFVQHYRFEKK